MIVDTITDSPGDTEIYVRCPNCTWDAWFDPRPETSHCDDYERIPTDCILKCPECGKTSPPFADAQYWIVRLGLDGWVRTDKKIGVIFKVTPGGWSPLCSYKDSREAHDRLIVLLEKYPNAEFVGDCIYKIAENEFLRVETIPYVG